MTRWNDKTAAAIEPTMTHSNNVSFESTTTTTKRRPLPVSSSSSSTSSRTTTRYGMNESTDTTSLEACIVSNPVDRQIRYATTAAAIMCLLSSIAMVKVDHPAAFVYTTWWIWSTLALWMGSYNDTTMHEGWLSWALGVSILMAVHHHMTMLFINHNNNNHPYLLHASALLVIPGACLFWFARQLHAAHDYHQRELLRRIYASSHRLKMLDAVAQEMQGVAGMITTTLEHFSPSSILARTHELLSACTIAVPITSISAIHTAIKQVHHVSHNLDLVTRLLTSTHHHHQHHQHHHHDPDTFTTSHSETQEDTLLLQQQDNVQFDIGGLVQNVGDALAGMAAKLDVYLVIYHADNGLHYSNVTGNEGIIRHTLLDLISRIMEEGCTPGATVEVGLGMASLNNGLKRITFDIVHTCSPAIPISLEAVLTPNSNFTAQLMQHVGGSLAVEEMDRGRTLFRLTLDMKPGERDTDEQQLLVIDTSSQQILQQQLSGIQFSNEPTRDELAQFVNTHLKGIRMVLHAPEQSVFATHLTSYLANLNVDISHIPISRFPRQEMKDAASSQQQSTTTTTTTLSEPTFVLIDDDTYTLEQQLREFRSQPPVSDKMLQHHQQMQRRQKTANPSTSGGGGGGPHGNFFHHGVQAIICFASLNKYKQIRGVVQRFSTGQQHHPFGMPRVVVVPKPAGPLRFLTALHTAWHNPMVEPHYFPIATTPFTPMTAPPPPHPLHSTPSNTSTPGGHHHHHHHDKSGGGGSGSGSGQKHYYYHHHHHHPQPAMASPLSDSGIHPGSSSSYHSTASRRPGGGPSQRHSGGSGYYTPPGVNWPDKHYFTQETIVMDGTTTTTTASTSMASSPHHATSSTTTTKEKRLRSSSGTFFASNRPMESRMDALATPYRPAMADMMYPFGTDDDDDDDLRASGTTNSRFMRMNTAAAAAAMVGPVDEDDDDDDDTDDDDEDDEDDDEDNQPSSSQQQSSEQSLALVGPLQRQQQDGNDTTTAMANTSVSVANATDNASTSRKSPTGTTSANQASSSSAPVTARRIRRMVRKKRRDKGTPFSGMASPPIHVLIVEDNKINQVILQTWMKKHNIKHSSAMNGQEAVEKWKGGGFHLVLMDIQLPVMNGLEATKTIRAIEKEQKIGVLPASASLADNDSSGGDNNNNKMMASSDPQTPFRSPVIIVALTASSSESDRHAALAAGCNDFLTKPVSLEWLEKKIVEWGCMQALIDFEGWRRWRQSTNNNTTTTTTNQQKMTPSSSMSRRSSRQRDHHTQARRGSLEEAVEESCSIATIQQQPTSSSTTMATPAQSSLFENNEHGVLLQGVGEWYPRNNNNKHHHQRRVSSMDIPSSTASPSPSSVAGQGAIRRGSSIIHSNRRLAYRMPSLPIRSGSDSDLFIGLAGSTAPGPHSLSPNPRSQQQPSVIGEQQHSASSASLSQPQPPTAQSSIVGESTLSEEEQNNNNHQQQQEQHPLSLISSSSSPSSSSQNR